MSDREKQDASQRLNPLEDIKGAARYLKNLNPVEEVKEFLETAARVLEPSESDLRVIEPEDDSGVEVPEPLAPEDDPRPREAHPMPDARALGKEHPRG